MTTAEVIASMTDDEKDYLRNMLNSEEKEPYAGTEVTVCFPDEEKLDTVKFIGPVPRKDEIIGIRPESFKHEEGANFGFRNIWKVKKVMYSLRVQTSAKDRLLYKNRIYAEVYVEEVKDYDAR